MPEMKKHVENIKLIKFEAPIVKKLDFMEICTEKVVHFPYKSSKFSENLNCRRNFLLHVSSIKLAHFAIFDTLFPILAFLKFCPIM